MEIGKIQYHALFTVLIYGGQFFICGQELVSTSGNAIEIVLRFITFTGCDLEPFFSFLIFMVTGLPWLLVLVNWAFSMFGSEIGAAAAIITGIGLTLLAFF